MSIAGLTNQLSVRFSVGGCRKTQLENEFYDQDGDKNKDFSLSLMLFRLADAHFYSLQIHFRTVDSFQ